MAFAILLSNIWCHLSTTTPVLAWRTLYKGENNGYFKVTSRFGLLLGFIALVCTTVSAGIYMLTKDKIDEAMAEQQKALLLKSSLKIILIITCLKA